MADPSASERAYQQLKIDLIKGALRAGPLDVRALGDRFRMSATPVREALARLNSEKLVSLSPHQGYVVPIPSARRLEGLYDLTGALVDVCLERLKAKPGPVHAADRALYGSYPDDMTALICEIAATQGNPELIEQIASLNDRLFVARRCEPRLFPDAPREVASFTILFRTRDFAALQILMRTHHRLRIKRINAIVRCVVEAIHRE